jgi:hypothetical protein
MARMLTRRGIAGVFENRRFIEFSCNLTTRSGTAQFVERIPRYQIRKRFLSREDASLLLAHRHQEGFMSITFRHSIVALLAATIVTGAAAASANDVPANTTGCLTMSKEVSDALQANSQSKNIDSAVEENKAGHEYCNSGMFETGLKHFARALELLAPGNG